MVTGNTFVRCCSLLVVTLFAIGCATLEPSGRETEERLVPGIFLEPEATRGGLPQGVEVRRSFDPGIAVTKVSEGFLRKDMNRAEVAVTALSRSDLTDGEFAALVDFTFNVGTGNFERSTLLRVVNNGDYQRVPKEFRKWVLAGGKKFRGLEERREREIKLFFNGVARGGQPEEGELIDIRIGEPK